MLLTARQVQKITKPLQQGTGGMNLKMSATQLKENMQKVGGFLPMFAGLAARAIPMIAKTVLPALGIGALSGWNCGRIQSRRFGFVLEAWRVHMRLHSETQWGGPP